MQIEQLNLKFGRDSKNRLEQAQFNNIEGALACLETFYYSFNNKDLNAFKKVWLNHDLIQLNNPLGGILLGINTILELYTKIFNGQARVWVEFSDIVLYQSVNMVIFAGREKGQFSMNGQTLDLQIRTSRIIGYSETEKQWFQLHHHGSIDNADLLKIYQESVI